MSAGHVTFTNEIKKFCDANGLSPSKAQIEIVNSVCQSLGRVGDDGTLSFDMGGGQSGSFVEIVTRETASNKTGSVPVTAGANATARAIARNSALRSERSEAKAAEAVALVERFGNPWKTGNHTHKAFVKNTNPTLAARLSAQVGMNP